MNAPLTPAQAAQATTRHVAGQPSGPLADPSHPVQNGIHGEPYAPNGRQSDASSTIGPPELEHLSEHYIPFGKLLSRMAQQTQYELHELIEAMADIQIQKTPVTNGLGVHSTLDADKASIDKKLRLMNFAHSQKESYIKALVLTDWARDMEQVNSLIELTMWLRLQEDTAQAAAGGILNLKQNMIAAKMPNPNTIAAIRLLSTGQAPWMPDLGYIPPKRLSATRLLQTLRDMDFNLFVRLSLHDKIPLQMRRYTIANGRVTFDLSDGFVLDLAAVDDSPDSQLYFIDLRIPGTTLSDLVRSHLEAHINQALSTGLSACYDFLHDYSLTLRISTLRAEAAQLTRHKWFGELGVDQLHRSLILHYWRGRPGPKQWFELGITSGSPSKISCRWHCDGRLVYHQIDAGKGSIESILEIVVAQHISNRLTELAKQFDHMDLHLVTSLSDPDACFLRIRRAGKAVVVRIESVTGTYSFTTSLPMPDQSIDSVSAAASVVRYLLCHGSLLDLVSQSKLIGWTALHGPPTGHLNVPQRITFQTHLAPDWTLTAFVDLKTTHWSLRQLSSKRDLPILITDKQMSSSKHLLHIADYAAAQLSLTTLLDELSRVQAPYQLQQQAKRHASLVVPAKSIDASAKWCRDLIEIAYVGQEDGSALHRVSGVVNSGPHIMRGRKTRDLGYTFCNDGTFSVLLRGLPNDGITSLARAKLRAITRMLQWTAACRRHGYPLKSASPDGISFRYAAQPPLSAQLSWSEPAKVKLSPRNPHCRILHALRLKLQRSLTSSDERHVDELCQVLRFTLPFLQAMQDIESAGPLARVVLNAHTATSFRLTYRSPLPDYTFAITAKCKNAGCVWLVQERRRRQGQHEHINARLAETWASQGPGWRGLRNGAKADAEGIADLMRTIDGIVRSVPGKSDRVGSNHGEEHEVVVLD